MLSDSNLTNTIREKFARAKQLQSQGKVAESIAEYRAILSTENNNLAALHQIGQLSEGLENLRVLLSHTDGRSISIRVRRFGSIDIWGLH